jgi:NAD(P)H dehydrogenase (quinone)
VTAGATADSVRVLVLFHSWTANTLQLAKAVGAGAQRVPDAVVEIKRVPELRDENELLAHEHIGRKFGAVADLPVAALDDVVAADVVFFGAPTRLGSMSAEMKSFIDRLGPHWQKGLLKDKVGAAFATASTPHGGQEFTVMGLLATLMHFGMIIVTPGYTDPIFDIAGAAYGAAATTKPGRVRTPPGADDLAAAETLGERATRIGVWVKRGRVLTPAPETVVR